MKKFTLFSILIILSMLLSSCSMHLGLSKLLGGGSSSKNGTPGANSAKSKNTPSGPVTVITIKSGKYRPKNATVKIGTTLTFTNDDTTTQSVTSDAPGLFDSGPLAAGASWKYTFSQAGTFPYHSTGTTGAYGSVTVTP
ncbi:MAG TPA: cupredoxin domain-containing protein [Anaerolineales bacterium]